jgi:hypothetical protein
MPSERCERLPRVTSAATNPRRTPAADAPRSSGRRAWSVRRHFTRLVKRTVIVLFAVSLVAFAAAYFFQPDTSIDYESFQSRFSAAIRRADFHAVEIASCGGEQVPFPFTLRPHRRASARDSRVPLISGFPDSADHYKLVTDASPPSCASLRRHSQPASRRRLQTR